MWFITVFEKIEPVDNDYPEFGWQRTLGFYLDHKAAIQALHENWIYMSAYDCDYAVIEKFNEGLLGYVFDSIQWFKFDRERKGYFEIDAPECVKDFGSFALG